MDCVNPIKQRIDAAKVKLDADYSAASKILANELLDLAALERLFLKYGDPVTPPPTGIPSTMSEVFLRAFDATMVWEGGYSNNPLDPGGETNFGIDKRSHPDEDIKGMTRERAKQIAWESYWLLSKAHLMSDAVSPKVFDLSFNTGIAGGSKILQRALNSMGATLVVDGRTQELTLIAVRAADPAALHAALRVAAEAYYRSLSNFPTFGTGWLNRNNAI